VRCSTPERLRATAEAIIEGAETFITPEDDEVDIEAVHRLRSEVSAASAWPS